MNTPRIPFEQCYDYSDRTPPPMQHATHMILTAAYGWISARPDPGGRTYTLVPSGQRIYASTVLAVADVPKYRL